MDALTLWEKIIGVYKNQITKQFYESFFASIEAVNLRKNELILLAPNYFIKEVIENNHMNNLLSIGADYGYKNLSIKIILDLEEITDLYYDKPEDKKNISYNLNSKYTFDTFVIGNSNRFAHAACVAVAESPARAYNPLFIYGGVGLGKTHLMHAIGHYIVGNNKDSKILYLSSETFTNELINSIKDDKNEAFRNKYRNVDVILVDDIQFIAGKERTQEEFFHTFNALHEANKQIIISSDRTPKEIPTLEDRLRSRFEMGLIADIQPPDFETRIAILRKKAQVENRDIPNEVMVHIAKNIKSNIRELEGALVRVIAYSDLTKEDITYELACEALKDLFQNSSNNELNSSSIKEKVSQIFSIKMEDFTSKKRTRAIAYPRQIAMYLCRELTDMSLPKIGEEFGGRDHTTVIHACDKIAQDMDKDDDVKYKIEKIIKELKA
ncbi:chromosomal replication initiator protein [Acetoanaerobium pronyense]|uniref:Chromosomal replication initiator protein DnaA n=1 Tax=Acetoanaerobium pronyense TaxID=1482736 RepID=A0ABS4KL91_9FIRM|nr:chromosomal replication initiator protein DnaA [Acetoanaerobium pronyense]MBP2028563.1 chromosomal replication initiator protein [Acetoanaerobium pronyense]